MGEWGPNYVNPPFNFSNVFGLIICLAFMLHTLWILGISASKYGIKLKLALVVSSTWLRNCFVFQRVEKWKKIVDCGVVFGALLTDLSKVFGCILHDLFIAKLEAYGFQTNVLNLVYDYLSNRKQ